MPEPASTRKRYTGEAVDVSFDPVRCRHAAECADARTLTPRRGRSLSVGHVVESFCMQNDTSGGSIDTEVKLLATRPTGPSGLAAQMATTPLGKLP